MRGGEPVRLGGECAGGGFLKRCVGGRRGSGGGFGCGYGAGAGGVC